MLPRPYALRHSQSIKLAPGSHRQFSLKFDKNEKKEESDYSAKFDELLGNSSKKLTKEEQDFINRQVEAKKIADERAQKEHAAKAEKVAEQKAQAFDDLLNGKTSSKPTSEKNLQELFVDFYSRAKTSVKSPGEIVNSAKSSLGGLGGKLEARRQKLKDMKSKAMDGEVHPKQNQTETQEQQSTQKMEATNSQ